jgi:hypothetical protein
VSDNTQRPEWVEVKRFHGTAADRGVDVLCERGGLADGELRGGCADPPGPGIGDSRAVT